ncbi:MAG: hypothetical protein FD143_2178 [Ignavibacteria bacterium]|nr:MAG: hypothetical protein FD143_2178 [Ignavibacteria bacterium]KAF0158653.1 MAG: hypothetical protein FD188_2460 [Ignavibacteria bacterium]
MILFLGTHFLAIGVVFLLHIILYKRVPKSLSYFVLYLVSFGMLSTVTVHGIWLGLTTLIIGTLCLRYYHTQKLKGEL